MAWRLGGKVHINVYENDKPICQCHDEETAKRIVDGMNLAEKCLNGSADIVELIQKAKRFNASVDELLEQILNHGALP